MKYTLNAPVMVSEALHYVVLKAHGASQSNLDEAVSLLRKKASAAVADKKP